jgi:hypothetical protein
MTWTAAEDAVTERSDFHRYVVWFADPTRLGSDEDREWPACFVVVSPTAARAKAWADDLSRAYAARNGLRMIRSGFDPEPWPAGSVPCVRVDSTVVDEDLGW